MTRSPYPALPPELARIFIKLDRLLASDEEQNKAIDPLFRTAIVRGIDCDALPGATGEFGRTPSNPIPTNGVLGEVLYLSRLRTGTGSAVMFHRLGSEKGIVDNVDVYDVLSLDRAVHERLYLSMYHPRKSQLVPSGYTYAGKLDPSNFTYGVNHTVSDFPEKLDAHIRQWQMNHLGIPLPVAHVREAINGSRFKPSILDRN